MSSVCALLCSTATVSKYVIENTYNHILQCTFGEPAVKKYRDEYVSQWRPEDLKEDRKERWKREREREREGETLIS